MALKRGDYVEVNAVPGKWWGRVMFVSEDGSRAAVRPIGRKPNHIVTTQILRQLSLLELIAYEAQGDS